MNRKFVCFDGELLSRIQHSFISLQIIMSEHAKKKKKKMCVCVGEVDEWESFVFSCLSVNQIPSDVNALVRAIWFSFKHNFL